MRASFSYGAKPCSMEARNSVFLHKNSMRTRERVEMAIAIPDRNGKDQFPKIRLSVDGIPCTDLFVNEAVQRQSSMKINPSTLDVCATRPDFPPSFLEEAYERCRDICAKYAKTYYLGTLLMTEERKKAIWAIYAWGRRTDELVDGPNAACLSSDALDRWEERLDDIFNGLPHDIIDSALTDTVQRFPLDIKPFKDMIEGMRMDTRKNRYANYEELYLYCYYVAGTIGMMTVPVMGIAQESSLSAQSIYSAALSLAVGNQLTNILRDVGEDASRGRIYLPQDELAKFGLCDQDVFSRKVTDIWREFMKEQIRRARFYFDQAEVGVTQLHKESRWPVWSSLMLYRMILDSIEKNDYDNLTKKAKVGKTKKLMTLPVAYTRALSNPGTAGL